MHRPRKELRVLPARRFFATRGLLGFALSPDGKTIAFVTNIGGRPDLWTVPARGGWPDQLTFAMQSIGSMSWSPDGQHILYASDHDGNESWKIYIIPAAGGDAECLTPDPADDPRVQYLMGPWMPDGSGFFLSHNRKDPAHFDVARLDLRTRKIVRILRRKGISASVTVSKDGKRLGVLHMHGNMHQTGTILSLDGGRPIPLSTLADPQALLPGFTLLPDGKTALGVTDRDRDVTRLVRWRLPSGRMEDLLPAGRYPVGGFSVSRDGRRAAWTEQRGAANVLCLYDLHRGRRIPMHLPPGHYGSPDLSDDGKVLCYGHSRGDQPSEIFTLEIARRGARPVQVTRSMIGGLRRDDFCPQKVVRYRSFDGLPISALLLLPRDHEPGRPRPAILSPHGGPEHHESNRYNPFLQYFAHRGYVVLAPNFRGSTGHGRRFQRMIYRDWGGDCYRDILAGVDYLVDRGHADPQRIAVVGGSFGGYMVLRALTADPDLWRAGVDICGPANLFTFLKSIPESWKAATAELIGDPVKDRALLREQSPYFHLDRLRAPLMVIQGKHDPRVHKSESDAIVRRLRRLGRTVEYVLYENEGHGLARQENLVDCLEKTVAFLDRFMS